jgi:hypothetical protein
LPVAGGHLKEKEKGNEQAEGRAFFNICIPAYSDFSGIMTHSIDKFYFYYFICLVSII